MSEAQDKLRGSGRIGYYVAEPLETIYREITGLLGISLGSNLSVVFDADQEARRVGAATPNSETVLDYDAILVDGISLTRLSGIEGKPLILVCGPVSGESPGLRLKTFAFNLGLEGTRLLMEGRDYTEKDVSDPVLDVMLEEIRDVLRREVRNYIELPPIPWGYAYAMTLTHDIDILSLKEMPIARTFLGYFYRSSVLNWKRWRAGKVQASEHLRAIWEMARTGAAKLGLGQDVWQRALPMLLELEKRLGVRSSLYFMAFPDKPGILPEHLRNDIDKNKNKNEDQESAPTNRASFYDVAKYPDLLNSLEEGGWEAGVHGIDAWHDVQAARTEHDRLAKVTGQDEIGVRMHWLYFQSPDSFKALEEGGFHYDATFGFNEVVGFRAGTLQPYHPLNCQTLWELPLHIQDGALMGEEYFDLNREDAFNMAKPILDFAKRFGGAVSLLWHNQSFTAPRFWGEVYERLIAQGKADGAWIAVPRDVLHWFRRRRQCEVTLSIEGTQWQIACTFPDQGLIASISEGPSILSSESKAPESLDSSTPQIPPVRVRLQLDPKRVRAASVPYEAGEGYIDFPAQDLITFKVEGAG